MDLDVTIAIPVYKRTDFFRETLQSALAQTTPANKILVVNDGSPESADEFRSIIGRDRDRVEYIDCRENLGHAGNYTRCVELASTNWVSVLHDDDVLYPNAVELLIKARQSVPDRGFYCGLQDVIDENSNLQSSHGTLADGTIYVLDPRKIALDGLICGTSGSLINRCDFRKIGGFNQNLTVGEEWDLWVRLALLSGGVCIQKETVKYRQYFMDGRQTTKNWLNGKMLVCQSIRRRRNLSRVRALYPEVDMTEALNFPLECHAARGGLLVHGYKIPARTRRIFFGYSRRLLYRKSYNASWYLRAWNWITCWLRIGYSVVRPLWKRFRKLGK